MINRPFFMGMCVCVFSLEKDYKSDYFFPHGRQTIDLLDIALAQLLLGLWDLLSI